ncbi:MAG: response regulator [Verrucomicrobiales bacterium]|jgi:CheY-like chemotaxis protein|nr:response regulator [Verrucomicrobiales bacterium]
MGKVLVIVDDISDVLVPLGKLFKTQGYEVHTFLNPLAALHFIRNNPADVVLSDYRMPQMDGVTFARVLRNIGWTGSLFFMSGYIAELNQQELMGLGINGILEKPFNAVELIEFVTRTLQEEAEALLRSPASGMPNTLQS